MINRALLSCSLVLIIFGSGCISVNPEQIAMANSVVQDFLSKHPGADVRVTYYSVNESSDIIAKIREDCGKETIQPNEFYLVNITENELNVIVWVNWETKKVECAFKMGTETGCISHHKVECYGNHLYWFDSCGNKEEKKERCNYGCENGACKNQTQCRSRAEFRCYEDQVYWFDSCGHKQEKKEYCNYGCENGFCKPPPGGGGGGGDDICGDTDGGINFYVKGTAAKGDTVLTDHCNDAWMLTENYCFNNELKSQTHNCTSGCIDGACLPENETQCTEHSYYQCYEGDLYWYDSCNVREKMKENCTYGCEDDACVVCTEHSYYQCYEDDVWWYDSCDNREEIKEDCEYGCENGYCINGTIQLIDDFESQ
jgi:hypothetical protein